VITKKRVLIALGIIAVSALGYFVIKAYREIRAEQKEQKENVESGKSSISQPIEDDGEYGDEELPLRSSDYSNTKEFADAIAKRAIRMADNKILESTYSVVEEVDEDDNEFVDAALEHMDEMDQLLESDIIPDGGSEEFEDGFEDFDPNNIKTQEDIQRLHAYNAAEFKRRREKAERLADLAELEDMTYNSYDDDEEIKDFDAFIPLLKNNVMTEAGLSEFKERMIEPFEDPKIRRCLYSLFEYYFVGNAWSSKLVYTLDNELRRWFSAESPYIGELNITVAQVFIYFAHRSVEELGGSLDTYMRHFLTNSDLFPIPSSPIEREMRIGMWNEHAIDNTDVGRGVHMFGIDEKYLDENDLVKQFDAFIQQEK
jgi:hypothetical protein